jgi:hypothetical protein
LINYENIKVLCLFLSFIVLAVVSCTNDADDIKFQKIIETTARGNTQTYVYIMEPNS